MAAKVVMVAVPTVLGIASIRVYAVREASADGLVAREKLNIYTPLAQPAQVQFVPVKPGVVESGVTTARESILPFVQAVKGVCVSVKRGSVHLYHAGEDVYYYLKDPPPGFLPRFGTVTMAGLLGMFLARKGSRFKRLAVPLGLLSAGASVCYPAQAVAVLKVTGKKAYAAGQWGRSVVSSLLTSVPQEPVAKESATVPNPEEASKASFTTDGSGQISTIPETESAPLSDEPVVTFSTEEASSLTLTDTSRNQGPTQTSTNSVAQIEATITSGEVTIPVEGEEPSNTKQALEVSTEASSTVSMLNFDPEIAASAPAEPAPKASDEPGGCSDFKPKPLMDFGQSNPDDADLYSTRS